MRLFAIVCNLAAGKLFLTVIGNCVAKFIGGPLLAMLFLMLVLGSPAAVAADSARAQLQVTATILTMIKVRVVSQPSQINIEQQHVSQGYIDVEDGSVLSITSNSPDGFLMSMTLDHQLVSHISARLSNTSGTMDGESMIPVRTQQVKDESMRISRDFPLGLHQGG